MLHVLNTSINGSVLSRWAFVSLRTKRHPVVRFSCRLDELTHFSVSETFDKWKMTFDSGDLSTSDTCPQSSGKDLVRLIFECVSSDHL